MRFAYSLLVAALLLVATFAATAQEGDLLRLEDEAVRAAVSRVAPSVVRIETVGGLERVGEILIGGGPTTGLVVSEEGHVLSSAFNFVQQPSAILVVLPSGARAPATIVARDQSRMLVLLKVTTSEKLIVPQTVKRSDLRVGQWTIAVGRTFDQAEPSVSLGVLSAKDRVWGKAIQTDAKISPTNYGGPLIDIEGRVAGILVPLSPQGGDSEVAGAEWYDSGIGFAVPLDEMLTRLEAMKHGKDQLPGLLGIAMKQGSPYSTPPEIIAAQAGSPASKAGIKKGDVIVEAAGRPIVRQSQLKHVLGAMYAGDKVELVVKRGDERVPLTAELVDKLEPYSHPFLGLLPRRDNGDARVVRFVYPDSPAAKAGIVAGDILAKIGGVDAKRTAAELHEQLAAVDPKQKLQLEVVRGGAAMPIELQPAVQPEVLAADVPPAVAGELPAIDAAYPAGLIDIKLAEDAAVAKLLVPSSYRASIPTGLLVWVAPPGKFDVEKWRAAWEPLCTDHQLIALAVTSSDASRWQPTEAPLIRKLVDEALRQYPVDATRVVILGESAGGTMALLVAGSERDRFRGVASIDAPPAARSAVPQPDVVNRLAVLLVASKESPSEKLMVAAAAKYRAASMPVTLVEVEAGKGTSDETRASIVRWIDTLDRL